MRYKWNQIIFPLKAKSLLYKNVYRYIQNQKVLYKIFVLTLAKCLSRSRSLNLSKYIHQHNINKKLKLHLLKLFVFIAKLCNLFALRLSMESSLNKTWCFTYTYIYTCTFAYIYSKMYTQKVKWVRFQFV